MAKNKTTISGIVYSTDPEFKAERSEEETAAIMPAEQELKVRRETKHRAGKVVTLVENFIGPLAEREAVGKGLKAFCGTGGSVKDNEILVQGDHRDKVLQWLLKNGYKNSKKI